MYKSFRLGREDNISKVLSSFRNHQHNVGGDFKLPNSGDRIDIGSLDALSARSFPLCMKTMHDALRTNHHLRHTARMQYSLFLKARRGAARTIGRECGWQDCMEMACEVTVWAGKVWGVYGEAERTPCAIVLLTSFSNRVLE